MTTLNPADKNYLATLSNGDLRNTGTAGVSAFQWARSTTSKSTGKHYFEVTVISHVSGSGSGAAVVDLSTSISNSFPTPGASGASGATYRFLDGVVFENSNSFSSTASLITPGDVAMVAVDCDADLVWYGKNGTFIGNPAAGTGGKPCALTNFYAMCGARNADVSQINFGGTAFAYSPPSGFSGWDSGGVNGNATGSASSVTLSLSSGAATGIRNASASGTALTQTLSLSAGTASAGVSGNASGAALSFAETIAGGAATGVRNPLATGSATTVTLLLVAGSASAGASANASGASLSIGQTLATGAATGTANASGSSTAYAYALSAGGAFGAGIGTAPGAALNYTMAVIGGAAVASANAGGAARSVSFALVGGMASAAGNANAPGFTGSFALAIVGGTAAGTANVAGMAKVISLSGNFGNAFTTGDIIPSIKRQVKTGLPSRIVRSDARASRIVRTG